jgi:hypothetical protein
MIITCALSLTACAAATDEPTAADDTQAPLESDVAPGGEGIAARRTPEQITISYLTAQSHEWLAPADRPTALAANAWSEAAPSTAIARAREDVAATGVRAKTLDVAVQINGTSRGLNGQSVVRATVTVGFHWAGSDPALPTDSEMSDEHELTFSNRNFTGAWMLVSDRLVEPPADPSAVNEDGTPAIDPTPAELGDAPAATAQILGSASSLPTAKPDAVSVDGVAANEAGATVAAAARLDYAAMGRYAIYWSGRNKKYDVLLYNPDYPKFDNDCTNFVSQALRAGGWQLRDGVNPANLDNWHYDLWGPRGPSYSWSRAPSLYSFARRSGRGRPLDNIWNARLGDILFPDWDPNGRPDGKIDHAMIVSSYHNQPYISQHSSHRQNIPLSLSISLAQQQGRRIVWYGLIT